MNLRGPTLRRLLTTIIVVHLLGSAGVFAQVTPLRRTAGWVGAAFGPTRPYEWAGVASVGFRYTRLLVRARYAITFESPGARVDDVGLLVGVIVAAPSQRGHISLGAGAGRVRQVYNCFLCSGPTFPTTTSFLVDAEGRLALARGFGLTAYTFGDVNDQLSFGGVALGFFLGGL